MPSVKLIVSDKLLFTNVYTTNGGTLRRGLLKHFVTSPKGRGFIS